MLLLSGLAAWMRNEGGKLSRCSEGAKTMGYMVKRWPALTCFLVDGRICLSNNAAERELRQTVFRRKPWQFAGSDHSGGTGKCAICERESSSSWCEHDRTLRK